MNIDEINGRQSDEVAQTLQGWTDQTGTAVAIVDEPSVVADLVAVLAGSRDEIAELAINGVPLRLLVGRDPAVDGRFQGDGWRSCGLDSHLAPLSTRVADRGQACGRATAADGHRLDGSPRDIRAWARKRPPADAGDCPDIASPWAPPSTTDLVDPERNDGVNNGSPLNCAGVGAPRA